MFESRSIDTQPARRAHPARVTSGIRSTPLADDTVLGGLPQHEFDAVVDSILGAAPEHDLDYLLEQWLSGAPEPENCQWRQRFR